MWLNFLLIRFFKYETMPAHAFVYKLIHQLIIQLVIQGWSEIWFVNPFVFY